MMPPISVAMTTCNGERFLSAQLDSILANEWAPAEIVVCDDASEDGTVAILKDYEARGLLRLYVNPQRLGIVSNFKKAVSLCTEGNYIAMADQDDVWLPGKLRSNAETLAAIDDGETPALIFSDLRVVDENLREISPSFWQVLNIDPAQENLRSLLFGNIFTGCTLMLNDAMRQLFTAMPDRSAGLHDAWLGFIAFTFGRFAFIREPQLLYRQHGGNATFETNQKEGTGAKLRKNLSQLFRNHQYLKAELDLAAQFMRQYESRLNAEQLQAFREFLALADASFVRKKVSAYFSRSYRSRKGH